LELHRKRGVYSNSRIDHRSRGGARTYEGIGRDEVERHRTDNVTLGRLHAQDRRLKKMTGNNTKSPRQEKN